MLTYSSIWAQDRRGVIGDGHRMLWRVPADFQFFKAQTMGCPVIMGRASFEALGAPLAGRENIVLTRDHSYQPRGVTVVHSLPEAFERGRLSALDRDASTVWIAGGATVYQQTMSLVDQLVVSYLDLTAATEPGQPAVFAPEIDREHWAIAAELSDQSWRPHSGDARWKVAIYERKTPLRRDLGPAAPNRTAADR